MKNKLIRLAAKAATVGMVVSMFAPSLPVSAAALTTMSDVMSRQQIATLSDHTIKFTAVSGVAAAGTVTVTFPAGFTLTGVGFGDLDLAVGTSACSVSGGGTFTDKTLAATASGATWGAAVSGQVITFTSDTDTIAANLCVSIEIGTVADSGVNSITNHSTAGTYDLALTSGASDTGHILIPVVDSDNVTVTANVAQTMVFDVRVHGSGSCAAIENGSSWDVPLLTLSATAVTPSSNHICLKLETNASAGAVIQVRDDNTGLLSATPSHTIASASATLAAGTEGYGLCIDAVNTTSGGPIIKAGAYSANTCGAGPYSVIGLTTTWSDLANSSSVPVIGAGHTSVDMRVAASIDSTTPASTLYTDKIYYRATATF